MFYLLGKKMSKCSACLKRMYIGCKITYFYHRNFCERYFEFIANRRMLETWKNFKNPPVKNLEISHIKLSWSYTATRLLVKVMNISTNLFLKTTLVMMVTYQIRHIYIFEGKHHFSRIFQTLMLMKQLNYSCFGKVPRVLSSISANSSKVDYW